MPACSGGRTAVAPSRPARLCTGCAHFDPWADGVLPGFAGSACGIFLPAQPIEQLGRATG